MSIAFGYVMDAGGQVHLGQQTTGGIELRFNELLAEAGDTERYPNGILELLEYINSLSEDVLSSINPQTLESIKCVKSKYEHVEQ